MIRGVRSIARSARSSLGVRGYGFCYEKKMLRDSHQLSEEEVNSILKKPTRKLVYQMQEFKFNQNYETDISQQLTEIQSQGAQKIDRLKQKVQGMQSASVAEVTRNINA